MSKHKPCPKCPSSDGFYEYPDGWGYCFSCKTSVPLDDNTKAAVKRNPKLSTFYRGSYEDLITRKISAETCKRFGYMVNAEEGAHIAPYYSADGREVGQKIRKANKEFFAVGNLKEAQLFGSQAWRTGGKRLVITEGELDALSYNEVTKTWPVVSIPTGAQGAVDAIRRSLEFVESYDEVVFLFDNDEHGREAAKECAILLTPGKAKIAQLPLKDASDMLVAGRYKELQTAVYEARVYRPDGVISGRDITVDRIKQKTPRGYSLPYPVLNEMIRGLRPELIMLTAGSGVGKSTLAREIHYHLIKEHGLRVGGIYLEESVEKTAQALVALDHNVPLIDLQENPQLLSDDQWNESFETLIAPNAFYDSWGSLEVDNLLSKMRFLGVGMNCDFLILDHVSMVVSGLKNENEREALDYLMTHLRAFVENTKIGVIGISHVNRGTQGKSFNEGGQISLTNLRGSAGLEQLSDIVIADERDQQSVDNPDLHHFRVLKNRPVGRLGSAGHALYDVNTGRLNSTTPDFAEKPQPPTGDQPQVNF